jgi:hypothetical protein
VEPLKAFSEQMGIAESQDLDDRLQHALNEVWAEFDPSSSWKPEGKLAEDFHQKKIADLERLLAAAISTRDVYLLIDNLDRNWQVDAQGGAASYLILGLVAEAQRLGLTVFEQRAHPIVFLRDDVRWVLEGRDPDAVKRDWLSLTWDRESLKRMIAERVRASLHPGEFGAIMSVDDLLASVFATGVSPFGLIDYIISRTLMIPRHAIWFCTSALDLARQRQHSSIEMGDILDAEKSYSKRVLKTVSKEFEFSGCDLSVIALWFERAPNRLSTGDVHERLRAWSREDKRRYSSKLADDVVRLLYESGFLLVESSDGIPAGVETEPDFASAIRRAASQRGLPTASPKMASFTAWLLARLGIRSLEADLTFQVHPAFHSALGIQA